MGTVREHVTAPGRQMEYLIEQYKKAHPDEDPDSIQPHLVADWAVARGMWHRPPVTPQERLRRELSRYLRGDYTRDPQGRHVRRHHAVIFLEETPEGPKKRSEWREIYIAPAKHMQASLALRRKSAYNDVAQVQLDLESYNDYNVRGETIPPMDFDFNKDLEESKLPTDYPDEAPEDDPTTDSDGEPI